MLLVPLQYPSKTGLTSFYRITDTTSLKSSIIDYIYENGRRYHRYKEGSYMLPNDEVCIIYLFYPRMNSSFKSLTMDADRTRSVIAHEPS